MSNHLELSFWINPNVIKNLKNYSEEYIKQIPYPHISIPNILIENKAREIKEALYEIEFEEFNTDLYQFFKSKDIKHIENLPQVLKEFHEFIFSKNAIEFFQTLTSLQIKNRIGDLHSILLQQTHYLLCHDDQVDERIIAFIVNLSEDFNEEDGGALLIYDTNKDKQPSYISNTITPKFNQLNVFSVSEISYHEISEIEAENKDRISISGWYYK